MKQIFLTFMVLASSNAFSAQVRTYHLGDNIKDDIILENSYEKVQLSTYDNIDFRKDSFGVYLSETEKKPRGLLIKGKNKNKQDRGCFIRIEALQEYNLSPIELGQMIKEDNGARVTCFVEKTLANYNLVIAHKISIDF